MTPTRSQRSVHAPPRLAASVLALFLVLSGLILAACSGGATSSFGAGDQTLPTETMGLESAAPSGY